MASTMAPRIVRSDEELQNLLALIKDVDSIELKLTVPEPAQLSTARAPGRACRRTALGGSARAEDRDRALAR